MANPLTLVMPLKQGVDLETLMKALDTAQPEIDAALKAVGTVHYARFVLFDASAPNLQPSATGTGPFSVSVITDYDGDFDIYIQDFVNQLGGVFDMLLAFTAEGENLVPVAQNVAAFQAYVQANDASQQAPNSAFGLYNAYPYTVQQILADVSG